MMKPEFKVIVCGGRDFGWKENANRQKTIDEEQVDYMFRKLDLVKQATEDIIERKLVIIQGEARGADSWAKKWAELNNVDIEPYPADWNNKGKSAGYIRNKQMLDEGKPDLVVAFKGGRGTAMMIELARNANVPVKEY